MYTNSACVFCTVSDVERIGAAMESLSDAGNVNHLIGTEHVGLPQEYWPCPLCLMTLLEAYSQGTIHHQSAFEALENSGLVATVGSEEIVVVSERGRAFVEMLLATPLPEQRWIDPRREPARTAERS